MRIYQRFSFHKMIVSPFELAVYRNKAVLFTNKFLIIAFSRPQATINLLLYCLYLAWRMSTMKRFSHYVRLWEDAEIQDKTYKRHKDTVHRGEIHGQRNGMWCNRQDELALHHFELFEALASNQQHVLQKRKATSPSQSAHLSSSPRHVTRSSTTTRCFSTALFETDT